MAADDDGIELDLAGRRTVTNLEIAVTISRLADQVKNLRKENRQNWDDFRPRVQNLETSVAELKARVLSEDEQQFVRDSKAAHDRATKAAGDVAVGLAIGHKAVQIAVGVFIVQTIAILVAIVAYVHPHLP